MEQYECYPCARGSAQTHLFAINNHGHYEEYLRNKELILFRKGSIKWRVCYEQEPNDLLSKWLSLVEI